MRLPAPFAGRQRWKAAALAGVALAHAGAFACAALLVEAVFDRLGAPAPGPWPALAALAALPLAIAALRRIERRLAESLGQAHVHAVRLAMFDHLGRLGRGDPGRATSGVHMQRFVGDLSALRNWVSLGAARLLADGTLVAGGWLVLASVDATLALSVAAVLTAGALTGVHLGRRLRDDVRHARRLRGRLAIDVAERIVAMPTVQAFGQLRRERCRVARRSERLSAAMVRRAATVGWLRGTMDVTAGVAVATVFAVAALRGPQEIGAGAVVAALSVVGVIGPALRGLARVSEHWHGYRVASARLTAFLAQPASIGPRRRARSLPDGAGAIELRSVVFGTVLRGIDLRIEPGQKVALVGSNGAGKSTLLSLIARLAAPHAGEVLVDGADLARCRLSSVRAAIGIVGPDLPLLRGTLGRNLRYRQPRADIDALAAVVHLCGLEDLIATLPGGLAHPVEERGANLSQGERQRVALARALLGRPRILLLDEPDANLDARSRALIDHVLARTDATVVFASHDLRTIRHADRVVCLTDGRLVEQGRPSELNGERAPMHALLQPVSARAA